MRRRESQRQSSGNTHMKETESKKEAEKAKARDVGENTEESFHEIRGKQEFREALLITKRDQQCQNFHQSHEKKLRSLIKRRLSELNESSFSRMVCLETSLLGLRCGRE